MEFCKGIYADDMVDLFGVAAVRYFLLHEMPFENDGVISWELVIERINSELANTLGNLVNRTISMSNKYFDGVVTNAGAHEPVDDDLKAVVTDTRLRVNACMDKLRVADAITEIFALFKRCNKYIDETMPWALAKDPENADRLNTVLYNLVESIVVGASLLEPYMPETSEKILKQLNAEKRRVTELSNFGLYPSGNKVTDQPERAIVAEIIREKALHALDDEIPHGIAVEIDRMKQRKNQDIIDIDATIVCERESHKGIIIGKGGAMLKKIGSNARYEMEQLLEAKVNLKLWVKVKKDWRDSDYLMKNFGYNKDEI